MPHPGKEIACSDTGMVKDMDTDFQESLRSYINDLLERPKYPAMTGAQMAKMMEVTVNHIQSLKYNISSPQEMSNYMKNCEEKQKTYKEFQQFCSSLSFLQLPGTMWKCISEKSSELVEKFEGSFKGNNADMRTDLVGQLREELKKEGEKFYSDYKSKGLNYAQNALALWVVYGWFR
ncbi:hypothetical protein XENTR_v10009739 [Xenopus tropicalis]|nr:hypothetical protein XENTR_v10009739 [Xenopus tropicalis]